MKTLAMAMIMAMTGITNAMANDAKDNFAYNTTEQNGQITSQTVYKVEDGKYLQHHLRHEFTYDAQGRVTRKETLKWNEIEKAYERTYCLNFQYSESGTDVEYALWNAATNDYSDIREKALYLYAGDTVNYLAYEWNEAANDWNLLVEHTVADSENVQLLANN